MSTDFHQAAKALSFETRAFIDGKYVAAASGKTFATVNPATGCELAQVAACAAEDVERATAAARRVFEAGSWSRMAPRERKKILLKFADLIEANLEQLALLETLDCGKPINDSREVDLPDTIETLRWHAEAIDKIYEQMSPAPHNVVSMLVREPIGVVAGVIPWNFPLFMAAWKMAPALAGGNSLILKPAELTSLSLLRLAELAAAAGIPDGVFNVVPGLGEEAGQAIGLHPGIDCVSFTGSGEVGRYFLEYSAKSNMKRIVLECGGKSPAIVMADVKDLAPVVENIATGILFCQGENCSAGSRLLVHRSLADRLLEQLKPVFVKWKVGDPLQADTRIGALIEQAHLQKVLGLIERGKAEGGQVTFGGKQALVESGGWFVEPLSKTCATIWRLLGKKSSVRCFR